MRMDAFIQRIRRYITLHVIQVSRFRFERVRNTTVKLRLTRDDQTYQADIGSHIKEHVARLQTGENALQKKTLVRNLRRASEFPGGGYHQRDGLTEHRHRHGIIFAQESVPHKREAMADALAGGEFVDRLSGIRHDVG